MCDCQDSRFGWDSELTRKDVGYGCPTHRKNVLWPVNDSKRRRLRNSKGGIGHLHMVDARSWTGGKIGPCGWLVIRV